MRARTLAKDILASQGDQPTISPATSISAFANVFLEDCAGRWKASTKRSHFFNIQRDVLPYFGDMSVGQVTRADVAKWFNEICSTKGARNRSLSVLSSLFVHAEMRGLRSPGSNPCAGMRRHEMTFKAHYLDAEGYAKLGRAFATHAKTHPEEVAMLRFCALTGCRKAEALGLEWAMIDRNRAALPDAKAGPRSIWLGRPARKLLAGIPQIDKFVFRPADDLVFLRSLARVWDRIRADLNRPKLRIHDLRHSFASVAVGKGLDLLVVGGLLGHSDKGSTAGYAHLDSKAVADASLRVGTHLAKVIEGPSKARRSKRPVKLRGDDIYLDFIRSNQNLSNFCARRGLNLKTFRREIQEWRAANMRAGK